MVAIHNHVLPLVLCTSCLLRLALTSDGDTQIVIFKQLPKAGRVVLLSLFEHKWDTRLIILVGEISQLKPSKLNCSV